MILSATPQSIGKITLAEGNGTNDRYFDVRAYYTMKDATHAYVYVQLVFISTSSVNGDGNAFVNGGSAQGFDFGANGEFTLNAINVAYNTSTGTSTNNSLTVVLDDMSAVWGDGTEFDATPQNSVSATYDLPNIDPNPNASVTGQGEGISIKTQGYRSKIVASITTVTLKFSVVRTRSVVVSWSGAGVNDSRTEPVTYSTTPTPMSIDVLVPASQSNYQLDFTIDASNNTSSVRRTANCSVVGYTVPITGSATEAYRCDSSGNIDSQGAYGKLHLTWDVTGIDTSVPNTLQNYSVSLNGTTIGETGGSVSSGYLDYLFPLATNTQGNLSIYLVDKIASNVITSFVVAKSIMPLSLYQSGDTVGVSIGRMATGSGFKCYEEFSILEDNGNDMHTIGVNANSKLLIDGVVYEGGGGGTIDIDSSMSDTSPNAVMNKTIKSYVDSIAGQKVDKETGKGLSTNDFTNSLKTKLDSIQAGAEANVQSDWSETNTSSDSYIQNKPTINNGTLTIARNGIDVQDFSANQSANVVADISVPTKTTDLVNDAGFITSVSHATSQSYGTVRINAQNEPTIRKTTITYGNDSTTEVPNLYNGELSYSQIPDATSTTKGAVTFNFVNDGMIEINGYSLPKLMLPNNKISTDYLKMDTTMSDSSANPVQNKVIKAYIDQVTPTGVITDVQVNGSSVVSGHVASVTVPTLTSDLVNDSGFITNSAISGKLDKTGGTMTGQLKTSYKNSVAMGSYGTAQTTVDGLVNEVRFSSGVMGSASINTAYTKNGVTIPTGWYNFIFSPHRSGGENGQASGDNCNYGTLILAPMTFVGDSFIIRCSTSGAANVRRIGFSNRATFDGNASGVTDFWNANITTHQNAELIREGNIVYCYLRFSAPSTATSGQQICTIPAGYKPNHVCHFSGVRAWATAATAPISVSMGNGSVNFINTAYAASANYVVCATWITDDAFPA